MKRVLLVITAGLLWAFLTSPAVGMAVHGGYALQVKRGLVLIDMGVQEGVRLGDVFQLVRRDSIMHPGTGEILVGQVPLGTVRAVDIFEGLARAEVVELVAGTDLRTLDREARQGLVRVYGISQETPAEGEETPGISAGSEPGMGVVAQVAGELVYVSGLNGRAPLWSRLRAANGGEEGDRALEVVKELDGLLVARVMPGRRKAVQVGDRVGCAPGGGYGQGRACRTAYAVRVTEGPRLDGRLDDSAWERAIPIEGFVQQDPDYWMPCSERTVARIVYDHERIYFGFSCFTSQPEKLVANNMRRDSEVWGDDNVQILLDTYNDRQNGFFFFVNPLGAVRDLMLSDGGRTYNEDWNCNWTARTTQHEEGWTAEVAIPFDQLRFKEGPNMAWGINLARYIPSKNESAQFVVGRRSSSRMARYWMSEIAELRGLQSVQVGRLLQVKPYILPGTSVNRLAVDPKESPSFEVGADLRYGVTSNMALDLSYNTDFAQVEGDQEQVNLTQFQLYFPEKRDFFLEGANLFDFGEAAEQRGGDDEPPTLLFYSRRIGLEEGRPVPLLLGTKLSGKTGGTSIGLLNVLAEEKRFLEAGDSLFVPRNDFSVVRIKQDLSRRLTLGAILVNKQTDEPAAGWGIYNRAGGVDFSYSPSSGLNIQGFAARTWDSSIHGAHDARFIRVSYSGGMYSARASVLDIENGFEPGVGFVNRRSGMDDFRHYKAQGRLRPRVSALNIRYLSVGPEVEVITDRENQVAYWNGSFSCWTQFNTGDWLRIIEVERERNVLLSTFSPSGRRPEISVPAGTYTFTKFISGLSGNRSRKLRPRVTLEAGKYYTGHRYNISMENAFRPSGRLSVETEYEANWLRFPEGNLNLQTLSNRVIYSFTTDFFVKLFAQWNSNTELMSANILVNYRFRPGSDFFFVYDHAFGTEDGFSERGRAVLLKVSYLLDL